MNNYLEKLPTPALVIIGTTLLALLGFVDYQTGHEYSVSLFYVLPVLLIMWRGNTGLGVIFSIGVVIVWQSAHILAGEQYSSPFVPVWNSSLRLGFFLLVVWQQHYSRRLLEQQRNLARIDSLTGAWNSLAFRELTERATRQSARSPKAATLVYFDLDGFKAVNDTAGHSAGDRILLLFVQTVKMSVRSEDIVARLGGDEFVLLLLDTPLQVAERRVTQIQQHFTRAVELHNLSVTVSAGLSTVVSFPDNLDAWIHIADENMYQAKRLGKNQLYSSIFNVPT